MTRKRNVVQLRKRCWLCGKQKPQRGGKQVTQYRHFVCEGCMPKVNLLGVWLLNGRDTTSPNTTALEYYA